MNDNITYWMEVDDGPPEELVIFTGDHMPGDKVLEKVKEMIDSGEVFGLVIGVD